MAEFVLLTMVVVILKKRQCRRAFGVGGVCLLLTVMVVVCYTTGTKMTAWSDFDGRGAEGLEGGRTAMFPRSVSLVNQQQVAKQQDHRSHVSSDRGDEESSKVGSGVVVAVIGGGRQRFEEKRKGVHSEMQVPAEKIPINKLNSKGT